MRLNCLVSLLLAVVVSFSLFPPAQARAADEQTPRIIPERETLSFAYGRKKVLVYRYAGAPFKPYISQLCTPSGVNVLLDSPPDHKHHHGLMFAIGAGGVDFWAETPECGKQVPQAMRIQNSLLSFGSPLIWTDTKNQPVLIEDRDIRLHPMEGVTLATWTSKISPPRSDQPVRLTGSHYFGLGLRFIRSMDKDGKWIAPDGKLGDVVRGDERLTPAKWCAYTAKADGKEVTVAMFDAPTNPRPALWFTMKDSFAYMSATINLWKEPMELKSPITFKYGVAVWDGTTAAEQIQKIYEQWMTTGK